jgi:hypothetical protein
MRTRQRVAPVSSLITSEAVIGRRVVGVFADYLILQCLR